MACDRVKPTYLRVEMVEILRCRIDNGQNLAELFGVACCCADGMCGAQLSSTGNRRNV